MRNVRNLRNPRFVVNNFDINIFVQILLQVNYDRLEIGATLPGDVKNDLIGTGQQKFYPRIFQRTARNPKSSKRLSDFKWNGS